MKSLVMSGLLLLICPLMSFAWDPREGDTPWLEEEIALFELVEEVQNLNNGTLYDLMEVAPNCTMATLKTEYKRLAMLLHPDKNKDKEGAEQQFQVLGRVYNMLKDKKDRKNYDRVLEEGLPNYRIPAFYDQRIQIVRRVGLFEGLVMLFFLASFIQYGMHWAAYAERRINMSANEKKKRPEKKLKKAAKKEGDTEQKEDGDPKPSVYDTLPFQIYEAAKYCVETAPTVPDSLRQLYQDYQDRKEQAKIEKEQEEEEIRMIEERKAEKKEGKNRQRIVGESQ